MLALSFVRVLARTRALVSFSLLSSASFCAACDDAMCPAYTREIDGRCVKQLTADPLAGTAGTANPSATGSMSMGVSTVLTADAGAREMSMAGDPSAPDMGGSASGVAGSGATPPVARTDAGAPGGPGAGAGGGDDASGERESCALSNELRCDPGEGGKRSQCRGGFWSEITGCGPTEVCAGPETTDPGACLAVAQVCKGAGGARTCDGSGTLYQCDVNEVIESRVPCGSRELCMPGLQTGRCATCVPSTFRCTGPMLEGCGPAGDGFIIVSTCASEALCNAQAGACTSPTCTADEKMCMGDDLLQCNAQRNEFQKLRSCGRGLCNATQGECNVCSPSALPYCNGNSKVTCATDGSMEIQSVCPMVCSQGQCVQCKTGDQPNCTAQCGAGTETCMGGVWGRCVGERSPGPTEIKCDNVDNDCNASTPDTCDSGLQCIQGTCSAALPSGTYQDTCTGCTSDGRTLTCAACETGVGGTSSASASVAGCAAGFANCGGRLLCLVSSVQGTYRDSCTIESFDGCILRAQCETGSGGSSSTSYNYAQSPCSNVTNCFGTLSCNAC